MVGFFLFDCFVCVYVYISPCLFLCCLHLPETSYIRVNHGQLKAGNKPSIPAQFEGINIKFVGTSVMQ